MNVRAFLVEQIAAHRASFDAANVRDYIDSFLLEQQRHRNDPPGSRFFVGKDYVRDSLNIQVKYDYLLAHINEGSYTADNSIGIKFLHNSRGLDVISLLVKYYVPLVHINKVIKLLKFKSAMNLQCF